jgi:hypothetical protein
MPPLAEIRAPLAQQWQLDQLLQRMKAKADELVARVKKGESLEAVAASAQTQVQRVPNITRQNARQFQGLGRDLLMGAFGAKPGAPFVSRGPQGGYLVAVVEKVHPGSPEQMAQITEGAPANLAGPVPRRRHGRPGRRQDPAEDQGQPDPGPPGDRRRHQHPPRRGRQGPGQEQGKGSQGRGSMSLEPALDAFAAAYESGRPQVVWTRLIDDLETPVSAYLKIGHGRPYAFLFESVEGGAWRGRYSIVAMKPDLVWRCRGDQAEIAGATTSPPAASRPRRAARWTACAT